MLENFDNNQNGISSHDTGGNINNQNSHPVQIQRSSENDAIAEERRIIQELLAEDTEIDHSNSGAKDIKRYRRNRDRLNIDNYGARNQVRSLRAGIEGSNCNSDSIPEVEARNQQSYENSDYDNENEEFIPELFQNENNSRDEYTDGVDSDAESTERRRNEINNPAGNEVNEQEDEENEEIVDEDLQEAESGGDQRNDPNDDGFEPLDNDEEDVPDWSHLPSHPELIPERFRNKKVLEVVHEHNGVNYVSIVIIYNQDLTFQYEYFLQTNINLGLFWN